MCARSLNYETRAAIERGAESMAGRYARRPSSPMTGLRCRIESVDEGGMLTVDVQGASMSIPATTACSGAEAGRTAYVVSRMGSLIAVGIISEDWSDNPNAGPQGPQGPAGPQGPQGERGPQGPRGNSMTVGAGEPTGDAMTGDSYIDSMTGDLYRYQ